MSSYFFMGLQAHYPTLQITISFFLKMFQSLKLYNQNQVARLQSGKCTYFLKVLMSEKEVAGGLSPVLIQSFTLPSRGQNNNPCRREQ